MKPITRAQAITIINDLNYRITQLEAVVRLLGCGWFLDQYMKGGKTEQILSSGGKTN